MRKKEKKYIMEKDYQAEIEFSEIDFDLYNELGIDSDDDYRVDVIDNSEKVTSWGGQSHAINIDRMIDALTVLKNVNKCEYVEIMYHEDHIGYNISGLNIKKHDEDSVFYKLYMLKKQQSQIAENDKKIKALEKQIKELKSGK